MPKKHFMLLMTVERLFLVGQAEHLLRFNLASSIRRSNKHFLLFRVLSFTTPTVHFSLLQHGLQRNSAVRPVPEEKNCRGEGEDHPSATEQDVLALCPEVIRGVTRPQM
jgi:hypothetical protein